MNRRQLSLLIAQLLATGAASATTFVVDTTDDTIADDGRTSLREAMQQASGTYGPDRIEFTEDAFGTIALQGGALPPITDDLEIAGPGNDRLTIDGAQSSDGMFMIGNGVTATISALSLTRAYSGSDGGAILNRGVLMISDLRISDAVVSGANGAGIANFGDVIIESSVLDGNTAAQGGGGGLFNAPAGRAQISDSTLTRASASFGGGVFSRGRLGVDRSSIVDNSATLDGGGFLVVGSSGGSKGAGQAPDLTISESTLSGNSAERGGGIFAAYQARLTAAYATFSDNVAGDLGGALYGGFGSATDIAGSTLSGNTAGNSGGAAYLVSSADLNVADGTIVRNEATSGGGLYAETGTGAGGTPTLLNSVVAENAGGDCAGQTPDVTDDSFFGDASCDGTADGDPRLGPLADNGGPTESHLPDDDSPLIDRTADGNCADRDQRGAPRPADFDDGGGAANCDIGAVERQPLPPEEIFKDGFELDDPED